MTSIWMVSQKDNEYNPCHTHTRCTISAVMYLKIPEYLPSRKVYQDLQSGGNYEGAITFTNNASKDLMWGIPTMTISPQVGDLFIFPASQLHQVYPFRTLDGKGERRSVSFNALHSSKSEQLKKQQQEKTNG